MIAGTSTPASFLLLDKEWGVQNVPSKGKTMLEMSTDGCVLYSYMELFND